MNSDDCLNTAFLNLINKAYFIIPGASNPYLHEPDCTYYPRYMIEVLAYLRDDLKELMGAKKRKNDLKRLLAYIREA